jgi:hypothetical protein
MNSKLQVQEYKFPEKQDLLDNDSSEVKELIIPPLNPDSEPDSTMTIIKDLQKIIERCGKLSDEEKLDYCNSQRYFIKEYLKKMNRKL